MSIDPGVRHLGIALWIDGILRRAALLKAPPPSDARPAWLDLAAVVETAVASFVPPSRHLAIERQRTYGGRASTGDANDLLELSCVVGAICDRLHAFQQTIYYPQDWKGSIPKPRRASEPYILTARIEKRLSEAERSAIEWPANKRRRWDVVDAIGIGLRKLGRL